MTHRPGRGGLIHAGWLGLVLPSGDGHRAALSFVVRDGRITRIDAIRNPEKLRRLQAKRRSITRTAFPARMPSRGRALSKEAPYAMGSIG